MAPLVDRDEAAEHKEACLAALSAIDVVVTFRREVVQGTVSDSLAVVAVRFEAAYGIAAPLAVDQTVAP